MSGGRVRGRWLAEHWIAILSPVGLVVAWQWASASGVLREVFFPRPTTVIAHLGRLAADGTLWAHTAATLGRVAWAFALAAILGVAVGLAMGLWRRLRDGLDPVFAVVYPIPSVLFLPLVSFLLPAGEAATIVTVAVTSFFLVALTTTHGVRQIDRLVLEAATHYGARGWRLFATVLLPGALPFIFTGLRLGLGYALIVASSTRAPSARSSRKRGRTSPTPTWSSTPPCSTACRSSTPSSAISSTRSSSRPCLSTWGAPTWLPIPPDARSAPGNPWRSSNSLTPSDAIIFAPSLTTPAGNPAGTARLSAFAPALSSRSDRHAYCDTNTSFTPSRGRTKWCSTIPRISQSPESLSWRSGYADACRPARARRIEREAVACDMHKPPVARRTPLVHGEEAVNGS